MAGRGMGVGSWRVGQRGAEHRSGWGGRQLRDSRGEFFASLKNDKGRGGWPSDQGVYRGGPATVATTRGQDRLRTVRNRDWLIWAFSGPFYRWSERRARGLSRRPRISPFRAASGRFAICASTGGILIDTLFDSCPFISITLRKTTKFWTRLEGFYHRTEHCPCRVNWEVNRQKRKSTEAQEHTGCQRTRHHLAATDRSIVV